MEIDTQDTSEVRIQALLTRERNARLVVFDADSVDAMRAGIQRAELSEVKVVSIPYTLCMADVTVREATAFDQIVREATAKGVRVYAAAGNHGATCDGRRRGVAFPAALPTVCAVGALRRGTPDTRSGRGPTGNAKGSIPDGFDDGALLFPDGSARFGTSIAVTRAALHGQPAIVVHRGLC